MTDLTQKQEKFCLIYLETGNATEAYRQAYDCKDMKPPTINRRAFDLMQNGKIKARLKETMEQDAEIACLNRVDVLEEVRRLAHSDISGIMHADGRVKLPHELDPGTRAAIKSFKIDEYGRIEYQFWDKNAALDKAARHLGLYEEDNRQKGGILADLPRELVQQLVERLKYLNGPKKQH